MSTPIKILLVDDHQILIDGIKALLIDEKQFEIAGEATRSAQAMELLHDVRSEHVAASL